MVTGVRDNQQPDDPEAGEGVYMIVALDTLMKLLIPITNKHAPIMKMTVKTVKSQWIDEELKNCVVERD